MQTLELPVAAITPNPDQPRKKFDPNKLRELAESIRRNGLQSPILVRPIGDRFEIVAGERRWRAHKLLDRKTIACSVQVMTDLERDVGAIIENLQREDITPLEEADAFARLVAAGLAPDEIAGRLGIAGFRVKWRLQLLQLAPDIRQLFESGNLDRQQAMEISRLADHAAQHRVLTMIRRGQLVGWKAVRNAVDGLLDSGSQADIFGDSAPAATGEEIANLRAIERRIAYVAGVVADGFKDGECIIACRVSRDRAALAADLLAALQKSLRMMERQLRNTLAQAALHA